ncbi:uncharacterized protein [Prorops nasuta]|uniref:uncharacterized protein n=1 Tax=Prorops nasuta TaxID=863751 RepID=UPI0034CED489
MSQKDVDALLVAQIRVTNNIINFIKNTKAKKGPAIQGAAYFEARLQLLHKYFDDLYARHQLLLPHETTKADHEYFKRDGFNLAESSYVEAIAELSDDIDRLRKSSRSPVSDTQSGQNADKIDRIKIPRVPLPKFSGKSSEWESFKQRFSSLVVDNHTYSDVDKLQFLLSSLEDQAAARVQNVEVIGENFKVVWDQLEKRFGNQRRRLEDLLEGLIQLKSVRSRNAQDISNLLDTVLVSVRSLHKLGCNIDEYNHWLVHCILRKLDSHTRETWKISKEKSQDFYKYSELVSFLENRVESLELDPNAGKSDSRTAGGSSTKSNSKSKVQNASSTSAYTAGIANPDSQSNKTSFSCFLCQANHKLNSCPQFNSMTPRQRYDWCKKSKLCLNCLHKSHSISECKSTFRCLTCKAKHHSKLHFGTKNQNSPSPNDDGSRKDASLDPAPDNPISANLATVTRAVLLATAQILVSDSFDRRSSSVAILGVGGQITSQARGEASISILSRSSTSFKCSCFALILNKLTCLLPPRDLHAKEWHHLSKLQLADPDFASPGTIDVILGADVYGSILQEGFIRGPTDAPVAQKTVFGWILTGVVDSRPLSNHSTAVNAYHTIADSTLSDFLTKFWQLEEVPAATKHLSPEEEYCEQYFSSTYYRNSEGRFVVRLPFVRREPFIDSRDIAVSCLVRSEKRRSRNPEIQNAYCSFMQEYEQLGHMRVVSSKENNDFSFYMPHHAVMRADSNKIRVVFNASQQGSNGYSLNDLLHSGPKLQSEITSVITDWRFDRIVIVTDIVKMYRQTLIHPDDLDWQRLIWRELPNIPIRDYQALTVTYGTKSAPFLALCVLQQLARDGRLTHPRASQLLSKKSYIDDIFLGEDNESEVQAQRDELIGLLATAGMELGKWSSNRSSLLQGLCNEEAIELPTTSGEIVGALGLKWDTKTDTFRFRPSLPPISHIVTKRTVLSDTARLFDPLGFIAPILVRAKILLQDLWINQLDWDIPLPTELLERWLSFRSALPQLAEIQITRWVGVTRSTEWHLHGFADASKRAYAAAVYAVVPGASSVLLMAKTRISPINVESIPRLELCGATLLVLLSRHILDNLSQVPASITFWSDSKVVLDWLKSHPSRWPTFVANRVSKIATTIPNAVWRHVPTKDNPADCASRGTTPLELAKLDLWWHGPAWITQLNSEWPSQTASQILAAAAINDDNPHDEILDSLERFSNFPRVVRIIAYCIRWKTLYSNKDTPLSIGPSLHELAYSKRCLFKLVQFRFFSAEVTLLSKGQAVRSGSALARLAPFIDEHGLIRVGGRLHNADLPYNERHPIILPKACFLVRLLVEDVHRVTLHGGVQLMKSVLFRHFWIIHGHRLIVSIYRTCVKCLRFGATPIQQQMAPLPADRLIPRRPFAITGLDFAGPFPILFSKGRGAKSTKGYVAIFICFTIKAVHMEVVSDMTTETFLAAFSRFTARRGLCSTLYSDNGTTFKGAASELKQLFAQTSGFTQEIFPQLAAQGTEWKFIPPRAPHFGGLWEAAVRCFKHHLRRAVGQATFTFEEFSTLVIKIEACLNSRPICPLSNEANDPVALTPGHFLVGSAPLAYPEPIQETNAKLSANQRWKLISQIRNSFWVRWRKEVFHLLQQRNKWRKLQPNLSKGDLVILTEELAPPAAWPLAIVTKTHPGKDNLVRVVTLRTATTELVRSVTKLIRLPVEADAEDTFAHFSLVFCDKLTILFRLYFCDHDKHYSVIWECSMIVCQLSVCSLIIVQWSTEYSMRDNLDVPFATRRAVCLEFMEYSTTSNIPIIARAEDSRIPELVHECIQEERASRVF